jgi:hypothetical protein
MRDLSFEEMKGLPGSGEPLITTCGVTVGITLGATVMFGLTGFLLTVNKAITACALAALA